MTYSIELTRANVTPAKFFAEIRFALKKKGINFTLSMDDFANPGREMSTYYNTKDGLKTCYTDGYKSEWPADNNFCQSEICRTLPWSDLH